MKTLGFIALLLVVIGGLNWGLVALGYNLVDSIFGSLNTVIYALVGLSAIYVAATGFRKSM